MPVLNHCLLLRIDSAFLMYRSPRECQILIIRSYVILTLLRVSGAICLRRYPCVTRSSLGTMKGAVRACKESCAQGNPPSGTFLSSTKLSYSRRRSSTSPRNGPPDDSRLVHTSAPQRHDKLSKIVRRYKGTVAMA